MRASSRPRVTKLSDLESLVDEMIKLAPREEFVRERMTALGLNYSSDVVVRMSTVLEALERIRSPRRNPMKEKD